jgi:hypothetical protein
MPFAKGHHGYRKHYTARVENVCTICGARELRRPCEVTPYCGTDCYHKSRAGIRPKETSRPCARCGKTMTNFVSQIGKYCSRACCDADKIQDPHERLWKYVAKVDDAISCWLWTAAVGTDGYGKFWYNGITTHAHRIAFELTFGQIDEDGLIVCHRCDNPLCVRPDHLFLGTHRDNAVDMVRKGRDRHSRARRERTTQ